MKKRKINLPLSYEVQPSFDEERFLKMRIKVMHSGLNLNNSYFGTEAIEKAKPSLANVPILAFIKKEDGSSNEDFAGHEFEIKITEDEMKYVYLGRPIGIIPETNNYSIETDEDGKDFVVVDGYVWKQYANSALDIINRDEIKKVSMEVLVDGYEWEESHINVTNYSYTGIAMLGENVREAMIGARAEIINYTKQTISDMLFELKEALKGGQEEMELENTQEFEETTETSAEETTEETTEEFAEETTEETQEETQEEFTEEAETETETETETEQTEITSEDFQAKIQQLQTQIQQLQQENTRLQEFVDATQAKAKQDAINELFEKFSDLSENEEASALKEKAIEMKLSEVETQLFALRGKYMTYSTQEEPKNWEKLLFETKHNDTNLPEWHDLVKQYKGSE